MSPASLRSIFTRPRPSVDRLCALCDRPATARYARLQPVCEAHRVYERSLWLAWAGEDLDARRDLVSRLAAEEAADSAACGEVVGVGVRDGLVAVRRRADLDAWIVAVRPPQGSVWHTRGGAYHDEAEAHTFAGYLCDLSEGGPCGPGCGCVPDRARDAAARQEAKRRHSAIPSLARRGDWE